MNKAEPIVSVCSVHKNYPSGESVVRALDGISFTIAPHEFVAITGPSGCGKSTLLHLLGGLDHPDSGEIFVQGVPLHLAGEQELVRYRRERLGIVFQFFNLLPAMTVVENVEIPLLLNRIPLAAARARALEQLDAVGLADRANHFPHQLSGGQMQRVAIARALVHRPALLLADEPTGNLDSENAARVIEVLRNVATLASATLILVTHSEEVARAASRKISLLDGKIQSQKSVGL
jgi:putative ABC transport system ATP-binding protein